MNVEALERRRLLNGSGAQGGAPLHDGLAPMTVASLVVNTLTDDITPNNGLLSLREAIAQAQTSSQPITFDPSLTGGTISLSAANGPVQIAAPVTITGLTPAAPNINAAASAFIEVGAGGSLQLANVSLTGSNTALKIDTGTAAALSNVPVAAPITDNGTLTASDDQPTTWSGPISGTGSVSVGGTQPLTLTGANSYTGGTVISQGALVGNTKGLIGTITGSAASLTFDLSLGPVQGAFFGSITSDVAVTVQTGTVFLPSGASLSNSEPTTIAAGAELFTGAANQLSSRSDYTVNGTLDLAGNDQTIASLAGSGVVSTSQAAASGTTALTLGGSASNATFSGLIEDGFSSAVRGKFAIQKTGDGTQSLASVNTFSGGTTVNAGTLAALPTPGDPLGSGTITLAGGTLSLQGQTVSGSSGVLTQQFFSNPFLVTGNATLDIRNSLSATLGSLSIAIGSLALTGDPGATAQFNSVSITGGDATLAPAANTVLVLRNISGGNNRLIESGSGAVLLVGNDSYSATVVNSGILEAFGATALPPGSTLNVASAGHVALITTGSPFTVLLGGMQLAGTLDVTTNAVQIAYTASDPVATIRSYLVSKNLYSSRSDSDHGIGYADAADGLTPDLAPNTVAIRYTLLGDTNLDGSVDLSDLMTLTRHFGQPAVWDTGDFNYNGKVDLSDFLAVSRHFGQSMVVAPTATPFSESPAPDPFSDPATRRRRGTLIASDRPAPL